MVLALDDPRDLKDSVTTSQKPALLFPQLAEKFAQITDQQFWHFHRREVTTLFEFTPMRQLPFRILQRPRYGLCAEHCHTHWGK